MLSSPILPLCQFDLNEQQQTVLCHVFNTHWINSSYRMYPPIGNRGELKFGNVTIRFMICVTPEFLPCIDYLYSNDAGEYRHMRLFINYTSLELPCFRENTPPAIFFTSAPYDPDANGTNAFNEMIQNILVEKGLLDPNADDVPDFNEEDD